MLSLLEAALILFVGVSAAVTGGGIVFVAQLNDFRKREGDMKQEHKGEMDKVYSKLRASELRIAELETNVSTLMRLVRNPDPTAITINSAGDATIGGDLVGREKS